MAWLAKRTNGRWRLLERRQGRIVTVIKNLGQQKGYAEIAKVNYHKALAQGLAFAPPIEYGRVEAFLAAKKEGRDFEDRGRRLRIEEMCDLYLKLHGPDLKGGPSSHYRSAYHGMDLRMRQIKRSCWAGKYADEIGKLNVRDFLAPFETVGTRMRWIVVLGHMFTFLSELNEDGAPELGGPVRLPLKNPVTEWRAKMKPHEKRELPDTRVLSYEEWSRFAPHLSARARAICEIALRRFLRLADIKKISRSSIVKGRIQGLQEKTGGEFAVPVISEHRQGYDFTNFHREFVQAQERSGLLYPPGHPLHFSIKDLRRTGATWYYSKTKDLRRVQKMLGHRKLSTTERYLHISDEDLDEVAQTMDRLAAIRPSSGSRCSTGVASDGNGQAVISLSTHQVHTGSEINAL